MIARAAGNDAHGFGLRKHGLRCGTERSFEQLAADGTLGERLRDGSRLLVDFLQHVVREVALLRRISRKLALTHRALHGVAVLVDDSHGGTADLGDVAFFQEHEATRDRQQRRNVGSDKILFVAQSDDDWTTFAREHDAIRIGLRDHRKRICALKFGNCCTHGPEEIVRRVEVMMNTVTDHFGVGLRGELVAELLQLVAQFFVILDDAVVHESDAIAGNVRMRVALARHAVRGPARVRNAKQPMRRILHQGVLQHFHFADSSQPLDRPGAVEHRYAGGVVAAVFEAPQALDEDGEDITLGNGTNDSAHAGSLSRGAARLSEISYKSNI